MAPAVPFALLGVVQLVAVAAWIGFAGAALFPRLRRRVTPLLVLGALAVATAEALTALDFGAARADGIAWLRAAGLLAVALGVLGGSPQSAVVRLPPAAAAGVVVPVGAGGAPSWLAGAAGAFAAVAAWWRGREPGRDAALGWLLAAAFALSGVAAVLGAPARTSLAAAVGALAVRGLATVLLAVALTQLARSVLLGKLVGAIVLGVVAMAAGAVGVVGTGVAGEVAHQQAQRLVQVADGERQNLAAVGSRAALFAQVVAQCPARPVQCTQFLTLFSDQPDYFAVLVRPGAAPRLVAHDKDVTPSAADLVQLAGSDVVRGALQPGATAQTAPSGPVLLTGSTPRLVVVAAVPGRPNGVTDARVRPTFAAVYGVVVADPYLTSAQRPRGYGLSVVADGVVTASSLAPQQRALVQQEARDARVETADPSVVRVVPAAGRAPTAAFVGIPSASSDDVRIATLALSQPADEALAAQRSVLRRLFLTALVAVAVVALAAVPLARRIADPVRRLTAAAGRVRRGDLDVTTSVRARDEVGSLARAFDAMTASLRTLTGDLRSTAEQEAATRARLETVLESMSDGLLVTDGSGRVTAANATAVALLGREQDAVVGQRLSDVLVVHDDDGRAVDLERTGRRTTEGRLQAEAGRTVPVRVAAAPLADGRGRVLVVADRSREDEVDRMKTEFLANVSHELRTPLTPIRGYAEILARRPDLERPKVEQFLDEILGATTRLGRIVELLVDVAALEGGRVTATPTTIVARTLVDERLAAWRERYPQRAGDFRRRVAARLPAVEVDSTWVARALDEFADNAVKYTPAGTAITLVAAAADGGGVRVAVRDAGPGFDPARAAELTGDFSQADASDTRRVGGLGLGLGFVSRVAAHFRLAFEVSTTPGRGAEFALTLPPASTPPRRRGR